MNRALLVRVLPFVLFMLFIAVEQGGRWLDENQLLSITEGQLLWLYPVKVLAVAGLLIFFRREYTELRWSDLRQTTFSGISILLGLLVFFLWINMDWEFAAFDSSQGFNPLLVDSPLARQLLVLSRLFGAVLVVPIMEELFWRSFMLRYIISKDFTAIRIGTYSLSSFLIGAVLFGLEHHLVLAGIMAGTAYSLLLYRTKSIAHCVLAHAVTNLALGLYVLQTRSWTFW